MPVKFSYSNKTKKFIKDGVGDRKVECDPKKEIHRFALGSGECACGAYNNLPREG